MNLLSELENIVGEAFQKAGFSAEKARVTVSNRPDLCEYQCNGCLALAKEAHMAPMEIANKIVPYLSENKAFSMVSAVMPGFINFNVSTAYLGDFVRRTASLPRFGAEPEEPQTIVVDYGGPNVAKPLHIGHLRSAIIGESVKRILHFMGHKTIGDTHLGDWGTQIGLIIEMLKETKPGLPYFDPAYQGEFPKEPPFSVSELEVIYPEASKRSKIDEDFSRRAHQNTYDLQHGHQGYIALWKHIIAVSVSDLRRNYDNLDVHFELWNSESDADPYIPEMIQSLKDQKIAYLSDGALVVDVQEETDKQEIPPCLVVKSDGASLYATTDLATVVMRMKEIHPDRMVYLADKRQELHYTQFFRVSRKAGFVEENTGLKFIGFGTMNGKDGKPFKTREGGVMRLETLISDVNRAVLEKMKERYAEEEISEETVKTVALSAIKYGDLSNQATKDYNFDIDRFCSFEGNTGPYILYTIVRIKSILKKAGLLPDEKTDIEDVKTLVEKGLSEFKAEGASFKALLKTLSRVPGVISDASRELAPHKICGYLYDLSDAFNSFYHETQILKEENEELRKQYLDVISYALWILLTGIDLLGFTAPEKM